MQTLYDCLFQIVCGPTDMSLIEPVTDFIIHYADHFSSSGIFWINACNEEFLEKQIILMEKVSA